MGRCSFWYRIGEDMLILLSCLNFCHLGSCDERQFKARGPISESMNFEGVCDEWSECGFGSCFVLHIP